jgi:prephenate dehydrogenase
LEKGIRLVEALGAQIIEMDAQQHDLHLAYVSHLSHVSSFMLAQTVLDLEKNQKAIFQLAGSGFASTVRLAKSSPEMWSPIFQQNAEFISEALQEYILHLQHFQHALLKKDASKVHEMLQNANQIKDLLPANANQLNLKPQEYHVEQL